MKAIFIIICCLLAGNVLPNSFVEKEIVSEVEEVTVFINGAQITRKKTITVPKGNTILKFVSLSPFVDSKSVQVKAIGPVTVLSVNHQNNYVDRHKRSEELAKLNEQIIILDEKIKIENTLLTIIAEELTFLRKTWNINGNNEKIDIDGLISATDFYSERLTALKLKELEKTKVITDLNKQKGDIQSKIYALNGIKEFPTGEILIKVESKVNTSAKFEVSYLVDNAGWYPSYDVRAKNVEDPIEITYKANVHQNTKVDWKNVKLRFSSGNPNRTGVAPKLKTYYLNYHTPPPSYSYTITDQGISGVVMDASNGELLPGVNVVVKGTTVGCITDLDGKFSMTLPENATHITFSYLGYMSQEIAINNKSVINVSLHEDVTELDEVVVVGYGSLKKNDLTGSVSGISLNNNQGSGSGYYRKPKQKKPTSIPLQTIKVENQTTFSYEVKIPYTIKSDARNYTVNMEKLALPAYFEYYCVPKNDKDAFLIANIIDWEQYNLMEGEANIFFEDTYIGKTLLDVCYVTDTLTISLGRDKNVSVSRDKVKEYTAKRFLGNKKEETRAWKIAIKNKKSRPIHINVMDQIPISLLEEIEVKIDELSEGILEEETGFVNWEFDLEPSDNKEMELRYSVKYPKSRSLSIE